MSSQAQPYSNITQFGRAWILTITPYTNAQGVPKPIIISSTTWQPEPLRMTFDAYRSIGTDSFWFADIAIYNLNDPTEQILLTQGMTVKLQAGYQNQQELGTIYEGTLFQPMWERENGVDFKLTLRCMVGLMEQTNNFVTLAVAGGLTQGQLIYQMAKAAHFPLDTTNVNLSSTIRSSRGEVLFGQPGEYVASAAKESEALAWFGHHSVNITDFVQPAGSSQKFKTLVYGPGNGLVGTPIQTQDGVNIKVLLDARAELSNQFQLEPSVAIKQFDRVLGQTYPTILDASGTYIIGAVRHYGDSRGEDWYTEMTGFTYNGSILALTSPSGYSE